MSQELSDRVRLGRFDLDLRSGELRLTGRAKSRLVLREQPFQVLRMLIERQGKIVTRDEIQTKLWPNQTIVDFDHSINVAVGALRRALHDSADNPRYIETLARRGYRLLVVAETMETAAANPKQPAGTQPSPGLAGLIGKRVSHYRVLEVIGGGGMGVVYKGEDLKLGRPVALKFLPQELATDPIALQRFEREARAASALNHPNICTIHGFEELDGQPFIVMELLEGETLLQRMAALGPKELSLVPLLNMALQICDGLQAAHDKGIIHRDIKPANIFLTKQGPVKILDFGVAKLTAREDPTGQSEKGDDPAGLREPLTGAGTVLGTSGYMSPEQIRKEEVDARTDIFFGLVLYEMSVGRRAFSGETAAVVHDGILNRTPTTARDLNPTVPRRLDAVLSKALEKDRSRRYRSAGEMRQDIERVRRETRPARRRTLRGLVAAGVVLILASGTWTYWSVRNRVTLSQDDTLVLADVTNQTGDAVFDDALYTALRAALEQTPYLNVLAPNKVRGSLRSLNLPEDAKTTPEVARQVCLRTNSKVVVATTIADAGNAFHIELRELDCRSGTTLALVRGDAPSRTDVVHTLGVAAAELRVELGEPPASIARFNRPLEEATSPSPEALQRLTEGYRHHLAGDSRGALQYYEQATALDQDFALAHAARAAAHSNWSEHALGAVAAKKAYELRNRLTEASRFQIEDLYYGQVTGELEKRHAADAQWVRTYPRDVVARMNFAVCLRLLGQPSRSLAEAREAARLLPTPWTYNNLAISSILADRLNEAKATLDEADARQFDGTGPRFSRALLAFLQQDAPTMQEQWRWAVGKPGADHLFLRGESTTEDYYGHFHDSRDMTERASALAAKQGTVVQYGLLHALSEAEVGNLARAQRVGAADIEQAHDQDRQLILALLLARSGDIEHARSLADALSQAAPSDTLIQSYSLPTIRAALKLHEADPAGAIDLLRPALTYELAYPPSFNGLYPAYVRGQAYLQMGEGRLAAQEFQKLLDHRGIVGRDVLGALSHLQLARAQKLAGDQVAARRSYEDFLALWKDADSDIPIYQEAKAEYANLREGIP